MSKSKRKFYHFTRLDQPKKKLKEKVLDEVGKLVDRSRGWPEGSLFFCYYPKVGMDAIPIPGFHHLPPFQPILPAGGVKVECSPPERDFMGSNLGRVQVIAFLRTSYCLLAKIINFFILRQNRDSTRGVCDINQETGFFHTLIRKSRKRNWLPLSGHKMNK